MILIDDILKLFLGREEESLGKDYLTAKGGSLFSAWPLPFVVCDKDFSIIATNPAFSRFFKIPSGKLKARTLFQLLGKTKVTLTAADGKEYQQITSLSTIVGDRNPKILEGEFPKIGKKVLHIFTRIFPPNILVLFQDMTESKVLEDKISKSRHELLSIFDGIDDPMVMIGKDFKIKRINESMLRVMGGANYRAFLGRACYFKLHGRGSQCPDCTATQTFARGRKTSRLGLLEGRPQADEYQYQITCHPLRSFDGKVTGIAESYRNITEVKRMEEELYESERRRIMEPLAAGIAHEVRNPLAIVRSTAQYCLSNVKDDNDLAESFRTIIKSTETANRVITGFVDFAKPEEVHFERQSLEPLLKEGLRLVRGRAKTQKVRLSKSIAQNLPQLFLDKKRFMQAYINFLMNALDAMPNGGKIKVEANRDTSHGGVRLIIRDSGEGIPEEVLSKIMQPFYSTKKEGLGLGISIAEGILRSHGGKVGFKSRPNEGTEVTVLLPIRKRFKNSDTPTPAGGGGGEPPEEYQWKPFSSLMTKRNFAAHWKKSSPKKDTGWFGPLRPRPSCLLYLFSRRNRPPLSSWTSKLARLTA